MTQGFIKTFFLLCGIVLTLAALPVFAQENANGITINKKPLIDFTESLKDKVAKKDVDLDKPFSVELEGVLTKDGKFDAKASKFIKSEGDPKMIEVVKQAMLAIGDSGYFAYLKTLGVNKFSFITSQDDSTVSWIIKSDIETENKAKTIASGANTFLLMGRNQVKNEDEKILFSSVNVTSQGKQFIINFALPKSDAQEMIRRRLQKSENKETMLSSRK